MSLYLGGPGDGGKGDVLEEDNEYGLIGWLSRSAMAQKTRQISSRLAGITRMRVLGIWLSTDTLMKDCQYNGRKGNART